MTALLIKLALWLSRRPGHSLHIVSVPNDVLAFARVKVRAIETIGVGYAGLADFKRSHIMSVLQAQFPHAGAHVCANAIQIAVQEVKG